MEYLPTDTAPEAVASRLLRARGGRGTAPEELARRGQVLQGAAQPAAAPQMSVPQMQAIDLAPLLKEYGALQRKPLDFSAVEEANNLRRSTAQRDVGTSLNLAMFGDDRMAEAGRSVLSKALAHADPLRMNAADVAYEGPGGKMAVNPFTERSGEEKHLQEKINTAIKQNEFLMNKAIEQNKMREADQYKQAIVGLMAQGNAIKQTVADAAETKAGAGGKVKNMPAAQTTAYIGNNATIKAIDDAIAEGDKHPEAFGAWQYLPHAVTQRMSGEKGEEGVTPRAKVADIGSLKIHDRSGAAVTASETPRLLPFIPQVTDKWPAARKKLENLKAHAAMSNQEIMDYAGQVGYKVPGSVESPPPAKPAADLAAAAKAELEKRNPRK